MAQENPQAALELLILKTLEAGPNHGFGIALHIEESSSALLRVQEGALYPALHRLERRGWIKAEWAPSDNNRNAKYYALTAAGRRQLDQHRRRWERISFAINSVLEGA